MSRIYVNGVEEEEEGLDGRLGLVDVRDVRLRGRAPAHGGELHDLTCGIGDLAERAYGEAVSLRMVVTCNDCYVMREHETGAGCAGASFTPGHRGS